MPILDDDKTRGIAAWPRQILHVASANRIDSVCEDDRHRSGHLLQCRYSLAGRGQDYIRRERSQFSSFANLRIKRGLRLTPSDLQCARFDLRSNPIFAEPCANAVMRACPSASFAAALSKHTDLTQPGRVAAPHVAIGHMTVVPPISVMNSRRRIVASKAD